MYLRKLHLLARMQPKVTSSIPEKAKASLVQERQGISSRRNLGKNTPFRFPKYTDSSGTTEDFNWRSLELWVIHSFSYRSKWSYSRTRPDWWRLQQCACTGYQGLSTQLAFINQEEKVLNVGPRRVTELFGNLIPNGLRVNQSDRRS